MKKLDLKNKRFGRLTVVRDRKTKDDKGRILWDCVCDCGKKCVKVGHYLKKGATQSCGCNRVKHGFSLRSGKHPLYRIWVDMKKRCYNKKSKSYANYGSAGITICEEWKNNPEAFIDWAQKNGWRNGLFVDRTDNNKGYSPGNCDFVTRQKNNSNKTKIYKNNTSGTRGVRMTKSGRYTARVDHLKKPYWLGTFDTQNEAKAAIIEFRKNNNMVNL